MKLFGKKLSTEEVLDATGREWTMSSMPGRDKRYEVKISAYFDKKTGSFKIGAFVGIGATFGEAAEDALRRAGLFRRSCWPEKRRTIDFEPVHHVFSKGHTA